MKNKQSFRLVCLLPLHAPLLWCLQAVLKHSELLYIWPALGEKMIVSEIWSCIRVLEEGPVYIEIKLSLETLVVFRRVRKIAKSDY
jgi:hypothetical protein